MAHDYYDYYHSTRRRQNILVLLVQPSWELRLVDMSPIHNFESTNYRIVDMSPIHDFDPNHAVSHRHSQTMTCAAMGPHNVSTPAYSKAKGHSTFLYACCWHLYRPGYETLVSSRNVKTLMVQDCIARIRVLSEDLKWLHINCYHHSSRLYPCICLR